MLKFALVLLLYVQITTTKTLVKRSRNVVSNGVGQAFYSEKILLRIIKRDLAHSSEDNFETSQGFSSSFHKLISRVRRSPPPWKHYAPPPSPKLASFPVHKFPNNQNKFFCGMMVCESLLQAFQLL